MLKIVSFTSLNTVANPNGSNHDHSRHCFSGGGLSYKLFNDSQPQETVAGSGERTLALAEQLKALANSGMSERVPSTRNCVGECGSVLIL
jgi:hypothetical protein